MKNIFILLISILYLNSCSSNNDKTKSQTLKTLSSIPTITVTPKESGALRNPLKGLMVGAGILTNGNLKNNMQSFYNLYPYTSVVKNYIGYNQLDQNIDDDKNEIDAYMIENWDGINEYGFTVIPRVILTAIYHQEGLTKSIYQDNRYNFWSTGLENGDFDSTKFRSHVSYLINEMGAKWDEDNRITAIQMGIIGGYGEHSDPALRYTNMDGSPTNSAMNEYGWNMNGMEKVLGDAYSSAFKNKTVEQNAPHTFLEYKNFGFYNDSIGNNQQWNTKSQLEIVGQPSNGVTDISNIIQHYNRYKDRWKRYINTGESALDLENGATVDAVLSSLDYQDTYDRIYNSIRQTHLSAISWIAEYDKDIADDRKVQKLQKALGYRFVINSVTYPQQINNNKPFQVELNITNSGSAPFYHDWKLKLVLLDSKTKQEVASKVFEDVDIREWMPGDNYQFTTSSYQQPAEVNSVVSNFTIKDIKKGTYILAIKIENPDSDLSTLRFATENYYNIDGKGYHPIGFIGIDKTPVGKMPMEFDNPQSEENRKLEYEI